MTRDDASGAAPRILLVEDDVELARAVVRHLSFQGYEVMVAHSRAAAQAGHDCYDFAILDIELPDASGVDLAKSLVEQRRVGSVVFYSSTRDAAALSGAAAFGPVLDKTTGIAEVLEVLRASKRPNDGRSESDVVPAPRKTEESGTLPTVGKKRRA
ncbi:MAG TPA: response regulator [Polyangiaceae bacterium]|jgi:DNA-binding response OmpR family regulator